MSFIQNLFTSRDNGANAETYVGQQGRLWWDPETNKFYYSDGTTPGGIPVGGGGGGNADPAGSNTQVQYNRAGSFGASSSFTYDYANATLYIANVVTSGNITATNFNGTLNGDVVGGNISGNIDGIVQAPFSYTDSTVNIVTVPAGKTITDISVIVFTAFSNPAASVKVGTTGNTELFVQPADSRLASEGTYTVPLGYYVASDTQVKLTVTSSSSSAGNGLLTLNYR